jgi:dienelactone hydrolase
LRDKRSFVAALPHQSSRISSSVCRTAARSQTKGANDPRVKQAESDQIVKALQDKKIPVTYVLFPDEGHGFARPENRLAFYAVTEAFLAKHLGGRYEAFGDASKGSTITVPTGAEDIPGLAGKVPLKTPTKDSKR